jgi:hypothetical protein
MSDDLLATRRFRALAYELAYQFRNGVAEATVICSSCKYCDAIV